MTRNHFKEKTFEFQVQDEKVTAELHNHLPVLTQLTSHSLDDYS